MNSYEILTGVGSLYLAPVGTAFPAITAAPSSAWTNLGETNDGVKVTLSQKVDKLSTDQRTGGVKAVRPEEGLTIETKLVQATLENLAKVLGNSVTKTAAGSGTPGTRDTKLYRGSKVDEYAILFRGSSPYGDYPAQFEVPRGYFDDAVELEHTKDKGVEIMVKFEALEDLNAATEADRFGRLIDQDAAAL